MDYPLGVMDGDVVVARPFGKVLIPILMDYPLGDVNDFHTVKLVCLNPYSNGLPSRGNLL